LRLSASETHEPLPEIKIRSPLTSRSGMWELIGDDGTATYDDFWMMVDYLAVHYDREPEDSEDQPYPQDRQPGVQGNRRSEG
jgi:hypothetical protein